MKTVKHYTWDIKPENMPLLRKKCPKCNTSQLYYCSGKFRMNSQKKNIDVWLIYRCESCDSTTNISIYSRTRPELINKELYQKFSCNDSDTARKYAFDTDVIHKNRMEADYSKLEYNISHTNPDILDMANLEDDMIEIGIKSEYNIPMKLTSLIRSCLNISLSQLYGLFEADILSISPMKDLKKCKVKDGMIILIDRNLLKSYVTTRMNKYSDDK